MRISQDMQKLITVGQLAGLQPFYWIVTSHGYRVAMDGDLDKVKDWKRSAGIHRSAIRSQHPQLALTWLEIATMEKLAGTNEPWLVWMSKPLMDARAHGKHGYRRV